VLEKMLVTEVFRMDTVHTGHASDVIGVKAALRVHLKACVVLPIVHDANLRIISCEAIADRSDQVCTCAPLRRRCHTALLTQRRATVGVVAVKITELLRTDLLHACQTVQGVPPAAQDVIVMARVTGPHDFRHDFAMVPGEAMSHCDGVQHVPAPIRLFSRDTAVLPCEADLRMGG
jgi:hypothetical protein